VENLWLVLIVFFACFTQGVSGFGSALVAMPLLVMVLGLGPARPLMAMVSGTLQLVLLVRYRHAFRLRSVWPLVVASALAVPVGFYGMRHIDERVTLSVLAVVVLAYAVYGLAGAKAPHLRSRVWTWAAGFAGGLLGAAYNTSGPPVVLYADARRWPPDTFKSNLQAFFCVNNAIVLVGHALAGNVTRAVGWHFLVALPAIGAGLAASFLLDRRISHATFRKIVLVLLVLLGVQLLLRALLSG